MAVSKSHMSILHYLLFQLFVPVAYATDSVSMESRQTSAGHEIRVNNNGPAVISIKAEISELQNGSSDVIWPKYAVIPAYASKAIGHIYAADKTKGYSFKTQMTSTLGNFTSIIDRDVLYRLPYQDGSAYLIGQSIGGPRTTHNKPENFFAIDFVMPEGTVVVAARDGVVVATEAGFSQGGTDPYFADKANYVRIIHDDGSLAVYAHLKNQGVRVTTGQRVVTGDVLGFSGSTGYSSGPHLHFGLSHVVLNESNFVEESLPILFYVGNPPFDFNPVSGLKVTADYHSPGRDPSVVAAVETAVVKIKASQGYANDHNQSKTPELYKVTVGFNKNVVFYIVVLGVLLILINILRATREKRQREEELRKIRRMFKLKG